MLNSDLTPALAGTTSKMNNSGKAQKSKREVTVTGVKTRIVDKENPDKMREKGTKKVKSATLPQRNTCSNAKSGRAPLRPLQSYNTQRAVLPRAVTSHLPFTNEETEKRLATELPSPDTQNHHKCKTPEKTFCDKEVQTETLTTETTVDYRMCTEKVPPVEYWQILAEQRRQALAETLTENEELCAENQELRQKIIELERRLDSKDYFAMMYKLACDNSQS